MEWVNRVIDSPPRASDEAVAEAEAELGVRLPPDFVEIARVHQGAIPEPNAIRANGVRSRVEHLYHFEERPSLSNIVAAYSIVAERLPRGLVPFAEGLGGDVVCFDYRRDAATPAVAVLLHDGPAQPVVVADSFDAFLKGLSTG